VKLSVIMPVYNEKNSIHAIINKVLSVPINKEIIVVDDCSKDGTRDILKTINNECIKVFFHDVNKGKGAAIRTGISHITGDYVIIQDADLEYDPFEYEKLLAPILAGEADVVYGTRFSGRRQKISTLHYLGNLFLTVLTNVLYGTRLSDMETCYKMMKAPILKGIKLRANRFDFEPEITAKLLKKHLKIKEVPISYHGREWSEGKKITWKDGIAALWALTKYRFVE
jgi:glycosyltransferase involved in cell wall biosynthesis